MAEYYKAKNVLHILDLVMSDDSIKHTGKAIRKRLKELPRADVVEVCRCKDCENYIPINETEGKCDYFETLRWREDYCSDGKKKEGDEDV